MQIVTLLESMQQNAAHKGIEWIGVQAAPKTQNIEAAIEGNW